MIQMPTFSDEDIRMLAKLERDMDEGRQPYVRLAGCTQRVSIDADTMAHFGLALGQTVTDVIWMAILQYKLSQCKRKVEESHAAQEAAWERELVGGRPQSDDGG